MTNETVAAAPSLTGPVDDARSWLDWLRASCSRRRFDHVHTVWQRAIEVRAAGFDWLDASRADRLVLAALLHDVGRVVDPADTEPHGFVGGRLLDGLGLGAVAPLVAHHSGARFEAAARGMADLDRWPDVDRELLHLLTYLDRTTSATGEVVSLEERRAGKVERFGADSMQVRIFDETQHEVDHARHLLGVTG